MEFLSLTRMLWRRKRWTIPASFVAAALVVYAFVAAPPTYRASGTIVLLNPSPRPVDPVTNLSPPIDNPYVRLGDLSVVVDIMQRIMVSVPVQEDLQTKGLIGSYEIAANIDFYNGPIIDVAAEADTPEAAVRNVTLVMDEAELQLLDLQFGQAVPEEQLIRTQMVVPPSKATTVLSGTLRRAIAAAALGAGFVLFMALLGESRAKRYRAKHGAESAPQPVPSPSTRVAVPRPAGASPDAAALAYPAIDPRMASMMDARSASGMDPRSESGMDPRSASGMDPRSESGMDPRSESSMDPTRAPAARGTARRGRSPSSGSRWLRTRA